MLSLWTRKHIPHMLREEKGRRIMFIPIKREEGPIRLENFKMKENFADTTKGLSSDEVLALISDKVRDKQQVEDEASSHLRTFHFVKYMSALNQLRELEKDIQILRLHYTQKLREESKGERS